MGVCPICNPVFPVVMDVADRNTRVVALGYEATYGPERRLAQNAVYEFPAMD